ncbi:MAG TPA: DUF4351 domain-containing protein [Blastocatellia bacterium]
MKLNRAKTHLLLGFIDTYLRLSREENLIYEAELEKLAPPEKESVMETEMSWWEQAMERGLQRGPEEGLQQARLRTASWVTRLAERQLGAVDADIRARITALDYDQLERLGEALFGFNNTAQLVEWLQNVRSN